MKINWSVWGPMLAQLTASVLTAQGKTEQAGVITDALAAAAAGKDVDDILRQKTEEWARKGEPTVDELVAARKEIQSRIG